METAAINIRVQQWIAVLSVVLLTSKLTAYFLTNSVAVLTDALESIVNVVAGFVGLYSLIISARPKDSDHPYGHGKAEFISAALEGSMIFIAGILIIYEAIQHLVEPSELKKLDVGMIIVAATGVVNYVAGIVSLKIGKRNQSLPLQSSGHHLMSDTYSTLGIVLGLALIYITDIWWIDSATAIVFAGIILYTGVRIVRASVAGIMDEKDTALIAQMVHTLNKHRRTNWIDLHNVRIIKYGSRLHIDAHLTVPWYLNVHEAHNEIDELSKRVKTEFDESLELFVHSDGCLEFSCRICTRHDCHVRKHAFEKQIEWTVENISRDRKHTVAD